MNYKQAKVLKDWVVTDENLEYVGTYEAGEMVALPTSDIGQLMQAGYIQIVNDYPSSTTPANIRGFKNINNGSNNVASAEPAAPENTKTEEKSSSESDKDKE